MQKEGVHLHTHFSYSGGGGGGGGDELKIFLMHPSALQTCIFQICITLCGSFVLPLM